MKLARVVGTVVSTIKSPIFDGRALLLVDLLEPDGREAGGYLIAVDTVGAGAGETVLVLDEGTSARQIVQGALRAAAYRDRRDRGRGGGACDRVGLTATSAAAWSNEDPARRCARRTFRPRRATLRDTTIGGTMADTTAAGDVVPAQTREELLALHAEARRRRNAAPLGSHEWEAASGDVGRIEIEIARLERAMDPPRV